MNEEDHILRAMIILTELKNYLKRDKDIGFETRSIIGEERAR